MGWIAFAVILIGIISSFFEDDSKNSKHITITSTQNYPEFNDAHKHLWEGDFGGYVDPNSPWGKLREKVFTRDNHICNNCGSKLNLTVHHKVPLSLGGSNSLYNLVTLCARCHEATHQRKIFDRDFEGDDNYGSNVRLNKKVELFANAIKTGEVLRIEYTDIKGHHTTREITPLELYKPHKIIYLKAYCHLRSAERIFRLSRVKT